MFNSKSKSKKPQKIRFQKGKPSFYYTNVFSQKTQDSYQNLYSFGAMRTHEPVVRLSLPELLTYYKLWLDVVIRRYGFKILLFQLFVASVFVPLTNSNNIILAFFSGFFGYSPTSWLSIAGTIISHPVNSIIALLFAEPVDGVVIHSSLQAFETAFKASLDIPSYRLRDADGVLNADGLLYSDIINAFTPLTLYTSSQMVWYFDFYILQSFSWLVTSLINWWFGCIIATFMFASRKGFVGSTINAKNARQYFLYNTSHIGLVGMYLYRYRNIDYCFIPENDIFLGGFCEHIGFKGIEKYPLQSYLPTSDDSNTDKQVVKKEVANEPVTNKQVVSEQAVNAPVATTPTNTPTNKPNVWPMTATINSYKPYDGDDMPF